MLTLVCVVGFVIAGFSPDDTQHGMPLGSTMLGTAPPVLGDLPAQLRDQRPHARLRHDRSFLRDQSLPHPDRQGTRRAV